MTTKTNTSDVHPRELRARLNQLYLRRTILNDVIGNLERYQSWLKRTSIEVRVKQVRYKRAAA
jgi:hypothetical protein